MKVVREPVLVMNEGSEFQTDGAEHRKACFVGSVLVNGTVSLRVTVDVTSEILYALRTRPSCSFNLKTNQLHSTR